jgi:hypothetical protein
MDMSAPGVQRFRPRGALYFRAALVYSAIYIP